MSFRANGVDAGNGNVDDEDVLLSQLRPETFIIRSSGLGLTRPTRSIAQMNVSLPEKVEPLFKHLQTTHKQSDTPFLSLDRTQELKFHQASFFVYCPTADSITLTGATSPDTILTDSALMHFDTVSGVRRGITLVTSSISLKKTGQEAFTSLDHMTRLCPMLSDARAKQALGSFEKAHLVALETDGEDPRKSSLNACHIWLDSDGIPHGMQHSVGQNIILVLDRDSFAIKHVLYGNAESVTLSYDDIRQAVKDDTDGPFQQALSPSGQHAKDIQPGDIVVALSAATLSLMKDKIADTSHLSSTSDSHAEATTLSSASTDFPDDALPPDSDDSESIALKTLDSVLAKLHTQIAQALPPQAAAASVAASASADADDEEDTDDEEKMHTHKPAVSSHEPIDLAISQQQLKQTQLRMLATTLVDYALEQKDSEAKSEASGDETLAPSITVSVMRIPCLKKEWLRAFIQCPFANPAHILPNLARHYSLDNWQELQADLAALFAETAIPLDTESQADGTLVPLGNTQAFASFSIGETPRAVAARLSDTLQVYFRIQSCITGITGNSMQSLAKRLEEVKSVLFSETPKLGVTQIALIIEALYKQPATNTIQYGCLWHGTTTAWYQFISSIRAKALEMIENKVNTLIGDNKRDQAKILISTARKWKLFNEHLRDFPLLRYGKTDAMSTLSLLEDRADGRAEAIMQELHCLGMAPAME